MKAHEALECVELVPLFQSLPLSQRKAVAALVTQKQYEKNEIIYLAAEDVGRFLIVEHGQIKLATVSVNGRESITRVLSSGDFDGEPNLFGTGSRDVTATALTKATVCQINQADFQQLLTDSPDLSLNLLKTMSQKIKELELQRAVAKTSDVKGQLARYLLDTQASLAENPFKLPLKKKDIATYLGTTPESISRALTELSDLQLIQNQGGQVKIIAPDELLLLI
ncbi:Crp/Fnr family transcriptional regulator [Lentilactobacillus senioris]|uniref:Crp/Fnr family transcriptional regulator n=1 Tax=Lentilactobacillus senioris TaxID=931534 RepID=UPI003D2B7C21